MDRLKEQTLSAVYAVDALLENTKQETVGLLTIHNAPIVLRVVQEKQFSYHAHWFRTLYV